MVDMEGSSEVEEVLEATVEDMEGSSEVEEVLEATGEDLEDSTVMEEILVEVVVVLVEVVV